MANSPILPSSFSPSSSFSTIDSSSTYPGKITQEQSDLIIELISILGEHTELTVGIYFSRLLEIQKEIEVIHPLKFLETILKNSESKKLLTRIFRNCLYFLQKTQLTNHFSEKMNQSDLSGWKEFPKNIGIEKSDLKSYFENKNWDELIQQCL